MAQQLGFFCHHDHKRRPLIMPFSSEAGEMDLWGPSVVEADDSQSTNLAPSLSALGQWQRSTCFGKPLSSASADQEHMASAHL